MKTGPRGVPPHTYDPASRPPEPEVPPAALLLPTPELPFSLRWFPLHPSLSDELPRVPPPPPATSSSRAACASLVSLPAKPVAACAEPKGATPGHLRTTKVPPPPPASEPLLRLEAPPTRTATVSPASKSKEAATIAGMWVDWCAGGASEKKRGGSKWVNEKDRNLTICRCK